ncbi:selenite/tellurite reduction operon b-type cytochrome membrane protein ExtQ [Trichloromonas sp.]|uniref:selenite/tellurite reduction operon b-type cytochrome membrane protein ExtQ n=1 Tax=Trichloromonas sp. TaxID=3069249 RepID=UPI003D813354
MSDYVKASPVFFRMVKTAFAAALATLLLLAAFIQAPLQGPADISRVPNPSKSAWFLMWTQELVSYSNAMIYLIIGLGLTFLLLPWLPLSPPAESARWLPREQRSVNGLTLISFFGILVLTIIAMYFRGKNWSFVLGF